MSKREEKIPEPMLRLLVLSRLNSEYPDAMEYKALEALMKEKVNCFPSELLIRVVGYLDEKGYVEGAGMLSSGTSFSYLLGGIRITAEGIDYLENLEEKIKLEVEKKEKELGMGFQP